MSDTNKAIAWLRKLAAMDEDEAPQITSPYRIAADLIEQQRKIEELELQVRAIALLQDEVAAQNESLGEALHQALIHWSTMGVKDEDGLAYEECEKRLKQSPQTSLAEHNAEVAESAIKTALRNLGHPNLTEASITIFANDYANKIRNKEQQQ